MSRAVKLSFLVFAQLLFKVRVEKLPKRLSGIFGDGSYRRALRKLFVPQRGVNFVEIKACGVHLSRPLYKVVCLVNKEEIPASLVKVTAQINPGIEEVIEVANHNVAKLGICQRQLIWANVIFLCKLYNIAKIQTILCIFI